MPGYAHINLLEVDDSVAGRAEVLEGRFGRGPMGATDIGVSHWRYAPGFRSPMGHQHREQDAAYLVISGSGQIQLVGVVSELRHWVLVRVSPEVVRASDGAVFYRKNGCPRCNHTGYRGRIGLYQLLRMSEEIASLAVQHASRDEIARAAMENGMRTMWDDGLEKVASGLTSIEELARVLA